MNTETKYLLASIALIAYLGAMTIRHIYLAYFKYPKLIEHFRQRGDNASVSYFEQWMKRCKSDLIWRYLLLTIASTIALGMVELGEFFIRAGTQ